MNEPEEVRRVVDECAVAISKARDHMIREVIADHMQIMEADDPLTGLHYECVMVDNTIVAELRYGVERLDGVALDNKFKLLYNKVSAKHNPIVGILECPKCHTRYNLNMPLTRCADCGSDLKKTAILGEHLTAIRTYQPVVKL